MVVTTQIATGADLWVLVVQDVVVIVLHCLCPVWAIRTVVPLYVLHQFKLGWSLPINRQVTAVVS